MTDREVSSKSPPVTDRDPDWYLRGSLSKIGGILDRFSGRKWSPASSLATSSLIEKIRRSLDDAAIEVPEKGKVVPHLIELRMQWNKFNADDDTTIEKLEAELTAAAADHINDRLYYTRGPLRVGVKSDYFTDGVKLSVSFGDDHNLIGDENTDREINVTYHNIDRSELSTAVLEVDSLQPQRSIFLTVKCKDASQEFEFPLNNDLRLTIGRGSTNNVVLQDEIASKLHAAISFDIDGNAKIADLGSTNGTYINGERIPYGKAIELGNDDQLVIGSSSIDWSIIEPGSPLET